MEDHLYILSWFVKALRWQLLGRGAKRHWDFGRWVEAEDDERQIGRSMESHSQHTQRSSVLVVKVGAERRRELGRAGIPVRRSDVGTRGVEGWRKAKQRYGGRRRLRGTLEAFHGKQEEGELAQAGETSERTALPCRSRDQ